MRRDAHDDHMVELMNNKKMGNWGRGGEYELGINGNTSAYTTWNNIISTSKSKPVSNNSLMESQAKFV